MKTPYNDMTTLPTLSASIEGSVSRYDVERNVTLPYIPLFALAPDINGEMFPTLSGVEDRFGSVSVSMSAGQRSKCTLKVYPNLVHYITARCVRVDFSATIHGYKSRLGLVQDMLIQLQQGDVAKRCGFRFVSSFETPHTLQ